MGAFARSFAVVAVVAVLMAVRTTPPVKTALARFQEKVALPMGQ